MITVQNLSHSYKDRGVLSNISFSIKSGEHVAILGKSGCGKTTLVNILAGFIPLKTGAMTIDGKAISKPGKNRVVVSQENDLFDWLTVWQNMDLVATKKERISHYLSLVELLSVKDAYPFQLSGGMKKRLSLARALVVDPSFLILDEPFASLDHKTRDSILTEVNRIQQKTHKTILHITHSIEEAIYLADRIILLGSSPTTILKEFRVNFPHPRLPKIKSSTKFKNLLKKIADSYI